MDPHLLDAHVAYALDIIDVIEVCRKRRQIALRIGDFKRVALEERMRNGYINKLEKIFADVRKLRKKTATP
jgi:hypothetical protein